MTNFQIIPIEQVVSNYFIGQLAEVYGSRDLAKTYKSTFSIPNLDDFLDGIEPAPETNPPGTAAVPPSITPEVYQQLLDLQLLHSYVSVVSLDLIRPQFPSGWRITDPYQAVIYQRAKADASLKVMNEGLSGILNLQQSVLQKMEEYTTTMGVHSLLLNELFGSFGFPDSTMKQLDSILINIVKRLDQLSISFKSTNEYLNFLVIVYYFEDVMGIDFKIPMMRLFYLNIEQQSWIASVKIGKTTGSLEKFQFRMNYFDYRSSLNSQILTKYRPAMEKYITDAVGNNLARIQQLTQPSVVQG
jgi:hypothetical protein